MRRLLKFRELQILRRGRNEYKGQDEKHENYVIFELGEGKVLQCERN